MQSEDFKPFFLGLLRIISFLSGGQSARNLALSVDFEGLLPVDVAQDERVQEQDHELA